jgi:hypothetical protein
MVHRDGSTREVETRGIRGSSRITVWWPLCGPYVVDLQTGELSDELFGHTDSLALWRMAEKDLVAVRRAYDADGVWQKVEPWPPQK